MSLRALSINLDYFSGPSTRCTYEAELRELKGHGGPCPSRFFPVKKVRFFDPGVRKFALKKWPLKGAAALQGRPPAPVDAPVQRVQNPAVLVYPPK